MGMITENMIKVDDVSGCKLDMHKKVDKKGHLQKKIGKIEFV